MKLTADKLDGLWLSFGSEPTVAALLTEHAAAEATIQRIRVLASSDDVSIPCSNAIIEALASHPEAPDTEAAAALQQNAEWVAQCEATGRHPDMREAPKGQAGRSPLPAREHARRRGSLDGADAQALEGALSQAERELAAANATLERVRELRDRHAHQARGSVFSTALVEYLDAALASQPEAPCSDCGTTSEERSPCPSCKKERMAYEVHDFGTDKAIAVPVTQGQFDQMKRDLAAANARAEELTERCYKSAQLLLEANARADAAERREADYSQRYLMSSKREDTERRRADAAEARSTVNFNALKKAPKVPAAEGIRPEDYGEHYACAVKVSLLERDLAAANARLAELTALNQDSCEKWQAANARLAELETEKSALVQANESWWHDRDKRVSDHLSTCAELDAANARSAAANELLGEQAADFEKQRRELEEANARIAELESKP